MRSRRLVGVMLAVVLSLSLGVTPEPASAGHGGNYHCTVGAGDPFKIGPNGGTFYVTGDGWQNCDYQGLRTYLTQKVDICIQKYDWWVFWSDLAGGCTNNSYVVNYSVYTSKDAVCLSGTNIYRVKSVGQFYDPEYGYYRDGTVYSAQTPTITCP